MYFTSQPPNSRTVRSGPAKCLKIFGGPSNFEPWTCTFFPVVWRKDVKHILESGINLWFLIILLLISEFADGSTNVNRLNQSGSSEQPLPIWLLAWFQISTLTSAYKISSYDFPKCEFGKSSSKMLWEQLLTAKILVETSRRAPTLLVMAAPLLESHGFEFIGHSLQQNALRLQDTVGLFKILPSFSPCRIHL